MYQAQIETGRRFLGGAQQEMHVSKYYPRNQVQNKDSEKSSVIDASRR